MPTAAPSVIIDCTTGEVTTRPLTAEEQTAWDALQVEAAAARTAAAQVETVRVGLYDAFGPDRTALVNARDAIRSGDDTLQAMASPMTAAQLTTAVKGLSARLRAFCDAQAAIDADLAQVLARLRDRTF